MDLTFTQEELKRLKDFKDDLHAHPELSHEEFETTKKIRAFLESIGVTEFVDLGLPTGLVAVIRGAEDGPSIGLRADIDAIRQTEEADVTVRSCVDGVMHGCGHDFHTTSLLGAAMLLIKNKEKLRGQVVLIFQHAEETTTGAKEMIDHGLFEKVHIDMLFGAHNRPEIPAGRVVLKDGALMSAKTNFRIILKGVGGHGSNPHLCVDPIVCAAALIQSLQTIVSRNIDPIDSAVFSICSIHGGSIENLIVDRVEMSGSLRCLSKKAQERGIERLERIVSSTAEAYECESDIIYEERIPLVFNSHRMWEIAGRASRMVLPEEDLIDADPSLASEDFSLMMNEVPSFFYWIGSGTPGEKPYAWHASHFHTNDDGLEVAAKIYAASAFAAVEELLN